MEKLSDEFMLITVMIKCPSGTKRNKKLEEEATIKHGIKGKKRVRSTVDIYNTPELEEIRSIGTTIRAEIKAITGTWDDQGPRLIRNNRVRQAKKDIELAKINASPRIKKFLDTFQTHIDKDRTEMGTLFDESAYPTREELEGKFSIEYDLTTVPDPEQDVRAGWDAATKREFTDRAKAQEERKIKRAMEVMAERVYKLVSRVSNRMKSYDGKRVGSYNDSLIDNVKDICDVLGEFNLTNNPEIEAIRKDLMANICSVSAADTREDEDLRNEVAKQADLILPRIGTFGTPPQNELND